MLSEGILVNMFCLSTRHHSDLSSPENARDGMELRLLLLISRLQAPGQLYVGGVGGGNIIIFVSPISLNFPTGNFRNPFPASVRANTRVFSSWGGRSAMATSVQSTAPRSSPELEQRQSGLNWHGFIFRLSRIWAGLARLGRRQWRPTSNQNLIVKERSRAPYKVNYHQFGQQAQAMATSQSGTKC